MSRRPVLIVGSSPEIKTPDNRAAFSMQTFLAKRGPVRPSSLPVRHLVWRTQICILVHSTIDYLPVIQTKWSFWTLESTLNTVSCTSRSTGRNRNTRCGSESGAMDVVSTQLCPLLDKLEVKSRMRPAHDISIGVFMGRPFEIWLFHQKLVQKFQ
jgi:hypothetical protein